jgi:magnesium transporter
VRLLTSPDGSTVRDPDAAELQRRVAASRQAGGRELWLDIEAPTDEDLRLLTEILGFHPVAVDDVRRPRRRPTLNEFRGYAHAVLLAASWHRRRLTTTPYHLFLANNVLVTTHAKPAPELDDVRRRVGEDPDRPGFISYLVTDAVVDTLFGVLEEIDGAVDAVQDRVVSEATPAVLREISELKHSVMLLHALVGAQMDVLQRLVTHLLELGASDATVYFRAVYDHTVRQFELVDSQRDLLTSATDVYLSSVSNRLNQTMARLTVVASLFLPLTFLTGFFGMNFAFLVQHISGGLAFGLSTALMVLATCLQLLIFRRRRWI